MRLRGMGRAILEGSRGVKIHGMSCGDAGETAGCILIGLQQFPGQVALQEKKSRL
jgi:hypothetical protein